MDDLLDLLGDNSNKKLENKKQEKKGGLLSILQKNSITFGDTSTSPNQKVLFI
jgi:hypothetical protein